MAGETVQFEKSREGASDKREQSTILFPYGDLDDAVSVARAVYARSGRGACDLDELAAEMGQTMSGAFRMKTAAARIFDLVTKEGKSSIRLTELGQQVVNSDSERGARAEAFLRVPLYAGIFEKYRGHLLPPPKALEREMLSLGVSSKQTDKARQAFERSARQAGFSEAGEDRLVRPKTELPTRKADEFEAPDDKQEQQEKRDRRVGGGGDGGGHHPFVQGLLQTMPEPGTVWTIEGRAAWLEAAANVFKLMYQGDGRITVRVADEPPKNNGVGHA